MDSSVMEESPAIQETLLEFRAGKMTMEGKRVVPDSRKGLVRIGRGQEGLVHLQWLDRIHNVVEDDQIIFPEEAIFERVNQASGRVYILKFHTDDRKFFFWMQEPNAENDTQLCSSVNIYINLPLEFPGGEEPDASVPLQNSDDMVEDDIPSRDGNMVGTSLDAEATSDVTSSGSIKLADLQRILSNIGPADEAGDPDGGLGLGDILKPDLILPLVETLALEQQLSSYLPEANASGAPGFSESLKFVSLFMKIVVLLQGRWTPEDLGELLQSPPFRQQVDSFTYVLRTGQIDLTQFGIDPSKYKFTVLSFLEALEDSVSKSAESEELRSQTCNQNDPLDESQ